MTLSKDVDERDESRPVKYVRDDCKEAVEVHEVRERSGQRSGAPERLIICQERLVKTCPKGRPQTTSNRIEYAYLLLKDQGCGQITRCGMDMLASDVLWKWNDDPGPDFGWTIHEDC